MRPSPYGGRRSAMRMNSALFLAAVLALSTLDGVAGEKQITDVQELAGTWRGWVTRDNGQERATMYVSADGSYRSLTTVERTPRASSISTTASCSIARRERRGPRASPKIRAQDCAHGDACGPPLRGRQQGRVRTCRMTRFPGSRTHRSPIPRIASRRFSAE